VLLDDEALVFQVLGDLESSALPAREKALLRYVAKVTLDLPAVTREDVDLLTSQGWDDEAIYFVVTTCALFNFYNRWISGLGVPQMSDDAHRAQGQSLAARGYTRS
jgi:alkylhydroperoxidase family enzyme